VVAKVGEKAAARAAVAMEAKAAVALAMAKDDLARVARAGME
jgi:hypothetical protein